MINFLSTAFKSKENKESFKDGEVDSILISDPIHYQATYQLSEVKEVSDIRSDKGGIHYEVSLKSGRVHRLFFYSMEIAKDMHKELIDSLQ